MAYYRNGDESHKLDIELFRILPGFGNEPFRDAGDRGSVDENGVTDNDLRPRQTMKN
jgi:hypothetical protein